MRWRRGIVIAILHLAVAVPLIVDEEEQYLEGIGNPPSPPLVIDTGSGSEGYATFEYTFHPAVSVVSLTNIPATALTGWPYPPRGGFTIAELIETLRVSRDVRTQSLALTGVFICLIFAQWLLIGGLPVVRPNRSWLEPSVLLLVCGAVGAVLVVSQHTRDLCAIPQLIALLTWIAWCALVVAKALRFGWRRLRDRNAAS